MEGRDFQLSPDHIAAGVNRYLLTAQALDLILPMKLRIFREPQEGTTDIRR